MEKHNEDFPTDLIQLLRQARAVCVLTGAGISAESGIPTFRDSQTGLWARYDPHELATPQAFEQNPQLVMDWYRWRRSLVQQAQPNPAHLALVKMEKNLPQFTLITQNVDGLHLRCGSTNVFELHGNLYRLRCSGEDCHFISEDWGTSGLITCPKCGALLRPDVVWFGENLSPTILHSAAEASQSCDLFFSVGTSGVVEPAASLPYEALRAGATVVEINPQSTPLSVYAQYIFTKPAGQILPKIVKAAWGS